MLEHTGGVSLPSREQFTQSSVHRLQFGGPCWIEIFSGARRGGTSISAAEAAAPASVTIVRTATAKPKCRMPRSARRHRRIRLVVTGWSVMTFLRIVITLYVFV
jgi:hypothetical protein